MKKLLIVDDISSNRDLIIALIPGTDWQILQAENGEIALELCLKEKPNLIITDIEMPKMKGTDFIKSVRSHKEISDIPVIFYTAANYLPDATFLCKSYGVPLVLVKPCDVSVLHNTLLNVMNSIEEEFKLFKEHQQISIFISDLDNLKNAIDALSSKSDQLAKENLQVLLKVFYDPKKTTKKIPDEVI